MPAKITDHAKYLAYRTTRTPGPLPDECWIWDGHLNPKGYGRLNITGFSAYAHRYAYETLVGPIPHGLDIHHRCERPACCNPAHMETVVHVEHPIGRQGQFGKAKTHCPQGHEYTEENTKWNLVPSGGKQIKVRMCRTCRNEKAREYRRRKKIVPNPCRLEPSPVGARSSSASCKPPPEAATSARR